MRPVFWKISTLLLLLLAATMAMALVHLFRQQNSLEAQLADQMAEIEAMHEEETAAPVQALEPVSAASITKVLTDMEQATGEASQKMKEGMAAAQVTLENVGKVMQAMSPTLDSISNHMGEVVEQLKKDLPVLQEKVVEIQQQVEAQLQKQAEKMTEFAQPVSATVTETVSETTGPNANEVQ